MADIFISYNREDRRAAGAVASALEREGFSVWWDAALRAGESYDEVTEKNLREAKAVVVLWSKRSAVSKWVRAEATIGERHSTLVPVMIEECDRPLRFELIQTADLTRWHGDTEDHNWRQFVGDIRRAVGDKSGGHGASTASKAHATAAASGAGDDATIETTFWTSIKDGNDPSDFEAYLQRYPHGHFAALAQNRLAALARAKNTPPPSSQRPVAAPPPAQRQPQQTAAAAPPPPRQPAPRPQQTQQRAQTPPPRPTPAEPKKGNVGMIIGLVAVGLIAVGGIVVFALNGGDETKKTGESIASLQQPAADNANPDTLNSDTNVSEEPLSEPAEDSLPAESVGETADAAIGETEETADQIADLLADGAGVEEATTFVEDAADTLAESAPPGIVADCDGCPRLVEVPAGKFLMGSPSDEIGRNGYEGPQREVDVTSFLIGETEVTAAQWAVCVEEGGCNGYKPGDEGYGGGDMPVMNISWRDANAYIEWLSNKTGKRYRLPTEAEWEYAARGGSTTRYWWGDAFERNKTAVGSPKPVGSFEANAFGLKDVTGNVREWVADCYVNNYAERPSDARAVSDGDCSRRVIRGGSWQNQPNDLRIANRIRITSSVRDDYLGFRVARDK